MKIHHTVSTFGRRIIETLLHFTKQHSERCMVGYYFVLSSESCLQNTVTIRPGFFSWTVPFLRCQSRKIFDIKRDAVLFRFSRLVPLLPRFPDFEEIIKCDSSVIKQMHQNSPNCMHNFKKFSGVIPRTATIGLEWPHPEPTPSVRAGGPPVSAVCSADCPVFWISEIYDHLALAAVTKRKLHASSSRNQSPSPKTNEFTTKLDVVWQSKALHDTLARFVDKAFFAWGYI